jgi:branched-chain amino acid aminotransferase
MTKTSQINYNGKIFPAESPVLTAQNRAFRYGDGLFETIRLVDGKIPLLALHFQRILRGLEHFKIDIPQNFTEAFLKKEILELAKKTGTDKNGRARLNLFRADGGLYGPDENKLNYLIDVKTIDTEAFVLNETGLKVDIYPDMEKHFSPVSAYKTNNALLYVLASIHKKEHELNDCLVMNSRSRIIESIDSNLFIDRRSPKVVWPA